MRTLTAILVALLAHAAAFAGWPDNRIVHFEDGGSGSFIQIGDCVLILSCAHRTIDTSVKVGEAIPYRCNDDSRGLGTVIAVYPIDFDSNPFRDAAIYATDRPPPAGVQPFTLTTRPTPPGTKVWVVGFPAPRMAFSSRTTHTLGYDGKLLLAGISTVGESGGPIVNERGEIVGTLTGTIEDKFTYGCSAAVLGELCREVSTSWCQNGRCQQSQRQYQQPQYYERPQMVPVQPPQSPAPKPPPTLPPVEIESKLVPIRNRADEAHARIDALEKQLNARIETLAQMQVVVNNDVQQMQQNATPNYEVIAAEVAKRLTHSATITLLDGTQKKQVKPLSEPLNFVQHSRGVK